MRFGPSLPASLVLLASRDSSFTQADRADYLSVQREFERSLGKLDVRGGVMNAYDRTNIFYYDVFLNRRVDQLPLFPYLAVKFTAE